MRKVILHPSDPDRPPFVITSDEGANSIILEADGRSLRIGVDEARRIAQALLYAVGLVDQAALESAEVIEGPDEP
jgi:hypothetical protein